MSDVIQRPVASHTYGSRVLIDMSTKKMTSTQRFTTKSPFTETVRKATSKGVTSAVNTRHIIMITSQRCMKGLVGFIT